MTKRAPVPAAASEPTTAEANAPAPQPETPQINLTARRQELVDAHARALHQVHYLEGALNEIDYLTALLNPQAPPQPATHAEGDK